jgi:hypothetical protein
MHLRRRAHRRVIDRSFNSATPRLALPLPLPLPCVALRWPCNARSWPPHNQTLSRIARYYRVIHGTKWSSWGLAVRFPSLQDHYIDALTKLNRTITKAYNVSALEYLMHSGRIDCRHVGST